MLLRSVTRFTCQSRLIDRKGIHRTSVELGTGVVVEERKARGGNGCNRGNLSEVLSKYAERCPFPSSCIGTGVGGGAGIINLGAPEFSRTKD